MGNCFKTQLKEVVNNDNLLKMSEFRVDVAALEQHSYSKRYIEIEGNNISKDITGGSWVSSTEVSDDKSVISVMPVYNVTKYFTDFDNDTIVIKNKLEDVLKFNSVLTSIRGCFESIPNITAFIDAQCKNTLTGIYSKTGFSGDISGLKDFVSLQSIYLNHKAIYGDIINLGNCISLTECYMSQSKCGGDLYELAAAQVSNGRNSGSFDISVDGTSIKLNGSTPTLGLYSIKFGSSMVNPTPEEIAQGWQVA